MRKSSRSPEGQFERRYLPAFFKAIDIDEPFQQVALGSQLEQITSAFWQQANRPTVGAQQNKRLKQYLRASQKKRKLRKVLGPTVQDQIVTAAFLRANPDADKNDLSEAVKEEQISLSQLEEEETEHELDIEFLIALGRDYRKRLVTKLVIEPALRLLKEDGIKPTRTMPLNRIALALFDVCGIAPKDRLSDAAIANVWRRLSA